MSTSSASTTAATAKLLDTVITDTKQPRANKMERRAKSVRESVWPSVRDDDLWDRKKAAGFTTMPRTMPQLINVINSLSKKGQPAGMTYLTIWCRLFVVGVVELASEKAMAVEAGFSGERAVDTWRKRMRTLKDLGFIDYAEGSEHEFQWVLVYNPHHAMRRLEQQKKVQQRLVTAWIERAESVGAKDLELPPEPEGKAPGKPKPAAKVAGSVKGKGKAKS
jgi:hypothetical protein